MTKQTQFEITPEPADGDREIVLAAVRELLRREEERARPAAWALGGWTQRRVGITDLRPQVSDQRRWALSVRLPWGGREFPGLIGRGDAK